LPLAKILYKEAKVDLLVYDISDKKSFEELKEYWYNAIKENVDTDAIIAIVANKSDLYNSSQVDENEAKEYAKSINALFQLTSAKSNVGINSLFDNIGQKYFDPNFDFNAADNKEKAEYQKKKEETKQKKKEPKGMKITNETSGQKEKKKKGFC
jgi:GTPase SAR1 family protein